MSGEDNEPTVLYRLIFDASTHGSFTDYHVLTFVKDIELPPSRAPSATRPVRIRSLEHDRIQRCMFTVSRIRQKENYVEIQLSQRHPPRLSAKDIEKLREAGWKEYTPGTSPPS